jgi:hypothetical protein
VLDGAAPGGEAFAEAGRAAAQAVDPSADVHGSAEYRKDLTDVLVRRALAEAITPTAAGATAREPRRADAGNGRRGRRGRRRWVGRPIRRVEDARHLTGAASFVDDIRRPGVLSIAFARSPHARRGSRRSTRRRALETDGVRAVLTGDDLDGVHSRSSRASTAPSSSPSRCRCSRATASATSASRSRS